MPAADVTSRATMIVPQRVAAYSTGSQAAMSPELQRHTSQVQTEDMVADAADLQATLLADAAVHADIAPVGASVIAYDTCCLLKAQWDSRPSAESQQQP